MLHQAVKKHPGNSSSAAARSSGTNNTTSSSQVSSTMSSTKTAKSQASKPFFSSQKAASVLLSSPSRSSNPMLNRQSSFKSAQQQPLNPSSNSVNLSNRCHGRDEKFLSTLNGQSGFESTAAIPKNEAPIAPPASSIEKLHQAVYFDENDFDDDINFDDDDDVIVPTTFPPPTATGPPKPSASSAPIPMPKPLPMTTEKPKPAIRKSAVAVPINAPSSEPIPWSSSPVNGHLQKHEPQHQQTVIDLEEDDLKPRKARTLPWSGREAKEAEVFNPKSKQKPRVKQKIALATPAKKQNSFEMNLGASAMKRFKKEPKIKSTKRANFSTASDFEPASKKQKKTKNQKDFQEMQLSPEQKKVLDIIIKEGKSVFFTGSAGTGKSVLLRKIIEDLRKKFIKDPERVAVTASTGLAALNIGGVTLHSFSGIGIGKESSELLVRKVRRSPKSKDRWLKTKVLVIDEVSMVDGELFDKLEAVARELRKSSRPFGGIQLVVTGDFFQLPPVSGSGQVSKFSFEAKTWKTCIEHTVALTQIFRQKDPVFASMLNQMRVGQLKDESISLFKQLNRAVVYDDGLEATELFPTRNEVENANRARLQRLPGPSEIYNATDSSANLDERTKEKLLSNLMAPKVVELRKDAQVMLIKNIDETLVNGSLGKVLGFMTQKDYELLETDEFHDSEMDASDVKDSKRAALWKSFSNNNKADTAQKFPLVQFRLNDGCYRVFLVPTETWKIETPTGELQASRTQIPLILSWALSIHKSQGQTLERVKVDLNKVFEKGQAYVALSRATSKDRLQVLNFDKRRVMVHDKVSHFYRTLNDNDIMGEVRSKNIKSNMDQQIFEVDDSDGDEIDNDEALIAEMQREEYGDSSSRRQAQW